MRLLIKTDKIGLKDRCFHNYPGGRRCYCSSSDGEGVYVPTPPHPGAGMVELITLGSGSRGNCTLLRTARSAILIDAGFSARQLFLRLEAVDQDPAGIDAIVITHEHS